MSNFVLLSICVLVQVTHNQDLSYILRLSTNNIMQISTPSFADGPFYANNFLAQNEPALDQKPTLGLESSNSFKLKNLASQIGDLQDFTNLIVRSRNNSWLFFQHLTLYVSKADDKTGQSSNKEYNEYQPKTRNEVLKALDQFESKLLTKARIDFDLAKPFTLEEAQSLIALMQPSFEIDQVAKLFFPDEFVEGHSEFMERCTSSKFSDSDLGQCQDVLPRFWADFKATILDLHSQIYVLRTLMKQRVEHTLFDGTPVDLIDMSKFSSVRAGDSIPVALRVDKSQPAYMLGVNIPNAYYGSSSTKEVKYAVAYTVKASMSQIPYLFDAFNSVKLTAPSQLETEPEYWLESAGTLRRSAGAISSSVVKELEDAGAKYMAGQIARLFKNLSIGLGGKGDQAEEIAGLGVYFDKKFEALLKGGSLLRKDFDIARGYSYLFFSYVVNLFDGVQGDSKLSASQVKSRPHGPLTNLGITTQNHFGGIYQAIGSPARQTFRKFLADLCPIELDASRPNRDLTVCKEMFLTAFGMTESPGKNGSSTPDKHPISLSDWIFSILNVESNLDKFCSLRAQPQDDLTQHSRYVSCVIRDLLSTPAREDTPYGESKVREAFKNLGEMGVKKNLEAFEKHMWSVKPIRVSGSLPRDEQLELQIRLFKDPVPIVDFSNVLKSHLAHLESEVKKKSQAATKRLLV